MSLLLGRYYHSDDNRWVISNVVGASRCWMFAPAPKTKVRDATQPRTPCFNCLNHLHVSLGRVSDGDKGMGVPRPRVQKVE
eukprot:1343456-Amorphochlora_amoeboformis.AAC.1